MSESQSLRVLVGTPPDRRLLDLLDRFSGAGWVVIYARKPEQVREVLEHRAADVAVLHPGMGGSLPPGCKIPLIVLGPEPLSVVERKIQNAVASGAGDRASALKKGRSITPSPTLGPASVPVPQARGGFTGTGRVSPLRTMNDAEFKGELRQTPLAVLLLDIAFERCTGILAIRVGEILRELAFRDGKIVAAASNIPAERLGAQLVRQGLITNSDRQVLQAGLERDPHTPTGQHLIQAKILTPEVVDKALSVQIERRLTQALLLQDGSFTWSPLRPIAPERIVQGPDLLGLVATQVLQEFGESQVSGLLAADASRVVRRTSLFSMRNMVLHGKEEAQRLAERIDNRTRLSALLDPHDILRNLRVFLLLYLGRAIGFSDQPDEGDLPEGQVPWGPVLVPLPEQLAEQAPPPANLVGESREVTPRSDGGGFSTGREPEAQAEPERRLTTPRPGSSGPPAASPADASGHRPVNHRAQTPRPWMNRPAPGSPPPAGGAPVAARPQPLAARPRPAGTPQPAGSPARQAPASESRSATAEHHLPAEELLPSAGEEDAAAAEAPLEECQPAAEVEEDAYTPPFPEGPQPSGGKAQALMAEGRALMRAGNLAEAGEKYESAWSVEPAYADGISLSGWCKYHAGSDEGRKEGLEDMQMAVSLAGREGLPFLRLGLALAEQGKYEQAILQFKASIKCDPKLQEARVALANAEVELASLQQGGAAAGGGGAAAGAAKAAEVAEEAAAKLKGWFGKGLSRVSDGLKKP